MQSLLDKLERVQVSYVAQLPEQDRHYCNRLFDLYVTHSNSLLDTVNKISTVHQQVLADHPVTDEDFYHDLNEVPRMLKTLADVAATLTTTLIRRIESYFKTTYNVTFHTYEYKVGMPFGSIEPVIKNMLLQTGNDLLQSGKQTIRKRCSELFKWERRRPVLKTGAISFPGLVYYYQRYDNTCELHYSESSMAPLLEGLSLFLLDSNTTYDGFVALYEIWKSTIEFNHPYPSSGVTFKFFKNGRLDIAFDEPAQATGFYQFLNLPPQKQSSYEIQ
jgi:hypothetical protein